MGNPAIFSGRRTKLLTADGILNSNGSKIDNDGAINYILNSHAEVNTAGWLEFQQTVLTTGTGGSPVGAILRSTTSPLRGSASFNYQSGTVLGEGTSYNFSINDADKAKVLRISMDYRVTALVNDGDYQVYIYDVTNATLIQPAGFKLSGIVGTNYQVSATFQTSSNSTSYRLIIWSSVATSAQLFFDNVVVSPQLVSIGGSVGDFQTYSPTIGAITTPPTLGSNTTSAQWRRVGGNMQIRYNLQQTSAGTAGSGDYLFPLPAGYTLDTTKIKLSTSANGADGSVIGSGSAALTTASSTAPATSAHAVAYNATSFRLFTTTGTAATLIGVGSGQYALNNTTVYLSFDVEVPISGWGSSQVLSSDTDTRVVAAAYSASGAISWTATGGANFDTKIYDTHGAVTTGANAWIYTVPVQGKYKVSVTATATSATSAVAVFKNGSLYKYLFRFVSAAGNISSGTVEADCIAGDILSVRLDAATLTGDSSPNGNNIYVERLSGPSQIAASESLNARYSTASGQSVAAGTGSIINFDAKSFDSHSSVTTGASWKFSSNSSGVFLISAKLLVESVAWTAGNFVTIEIYKNGASVSTLSYLAIVVTGSFYYGLTGCDSIRLNSGDYVDVRLSHNRSGNVALNANSPQNYISIQRVGN
jgi:hypothetical protein